MSSFSVKYKTSLFGNMDRNNMRSSYVNSGPRSLPHMSGKRHNGNGHNGNSHSGNHSNHGNHGNHGNHSGNHGNGHNGARLSPPAQGMPGNQHPHNNNNNPNGHDDIINYIYDSWNKVTRELERGSDEAKYYQEVVPSRHLANFKPFNLEEWWGRRIIQSINRNKHRS